MKIHHLFIFFAVIATVILGVYFIKTSTSRYTYNETIKCTNELTSALLDSITEVTERSETNGRLFETEKNRKIAYDSFYSTLSLNLNNYLTKDKYIQDTIPCLFLVDYDGYYVVYRETDSDNTMHTVVSPINIWSEETLNGSFVLRYYLNDHVQVIDRAVGTHYEGTRADVYAELTNDGYAYAFANTLKTDAIYKEAREYRIWKTLEEQLNYYVNKYNVYSEYYYELQIPNMQGLSNGKCIDNPCMFALMQGKYYGLPTTNANVYAYANAEVNTPIMYVGGNGTYHVKGCPYAYSENFVGTMEDCTYEGLYPCPYCIK